MERRFRSLRSRDTSNNARTHSGTMHQDLCALRLILLAAQPGFSILVFPLLKPTLDISRYIVITGLIMLANNYQLEL